MKMNKLQAQIEEMVRKADPVNAEYILMDYSFYDRIGTAIRFNENGDQKMVEFMIKDIKEQALEYKKKFLTPANIEVGDGVTYHLYSDAHAGTVIKKTKMSVTVQRDKATRDPNFKPEIVPGGFAGHCTNQHEQTYTYEADPNGETITFRWSKKFGRFQDGQRGLTLTKGRREFYDYNF
jgi:hypothetical protein